MEYITSVSQCPQMRGLVILSDFRFLIAHLKSALGQTGVVSTVTIMNASNEYCQSYREHKFRTSYLLKLGADTLPLVSLCELFDYLPVILHNTDANY